MRRHLRLPALLERIDAEEPRRGVRCRPRWVQPLCRQGAHELGGVVTPVCSDGGFAAPARRLDATLDMQQRSLTFDGPGGCSRVCVQIEERPVPIFGQGMRGVA